MLDKIKSSYYINNLFSFINDKTKLNLIKYNKNIQNKIDININNFKIFSGRIIIYEAKEKTKGLKKGKEYDIFTGILKYEGEYLNGERNGEGKEYDLYNNLIFKGKYLKGKKWEGKGYKKNDEMIFELKDGKGHVKEFNHHYNMLFEGEYLNGERNGKGKEYYNYIKLKFEGEYFNGKRWNGKGYSPNNNLIYELNSGKGYVIEYGNNGCLAFEGEYLNGEKNGQGKEYYRKNSNFTYEENEKYIIKYDGEYKNGLKNGRGKEYDLDGNLIYEGEYLYNYRRKGKAYTENRLEFEGEYYFNQKWSGKGYDENGKIIYELNDGTGFVKEYNGFKEKITYEGNIVKGIKNGHGKVFDDLTGNLIFEGEFKSGKKNGKGKEIDVLTGLTIFDGEYLKGKRNGFGKEYSLFNCKLLYEGEYLNGEKNGFGKEYDIKGNLAFEGEFKNGNKVKKNYYFYYFLGFIFLIIAKLFMNK